MDKNDTRFIAETIADSILFEKLVFNQNDDFESITIKATFQVADVGISLICEYKEENILPISSAVNCRFFTLKQVCDFLNVRFSLALFYAEEKIPTQLHNKFPNLMDESGTGINPFTYDQIIDVIEFLYKLKKFSSLK